MKEAQLWSLLQQHLPLTAIEYCIGLWQNHPFLIKITKSRQTKAGDFYCASPNATPRITLNEDLNPYLFLVTYIHEVAHLYVYHRHARKVDPHGMEWKNAFRQLLAPVLNKEIFPEPLFSMLCQHMENPMASTFADARLTKTFRLYDKHGPQTTVYDLPEGSLFVLRGKYFKKGKLRRTRFLCQEIKSKRQYLVPAEALIEQAQLSFLLDS